jgi:hypothetical protein
MFINQLQAILDYCCPGLEIEQYCAGAEGAAAPPAPAGPLGDGAYPNYGNCTCTLVSEDVPALPNTETTTQPQG